MGKVLEQGTRQQRHGLVVESSQRRLHLTGLYVDDAQSSHRRRVRSSGFGGRDDRGGVLAETCFGAPSCEATQLISCWNLQTLVVGDSNVAVTSFTHTQSSRGADARFWLKAQAEALVSRWP